MYFDIERYINKLEPDYIDSLTETPDKQFVFLMLLQQNIEKIRVFNLLLQNSVTAFIIERQKQEKFLEEFKKIVILEKPQFIEIMLFFDEMFKEYFKQSNFIYN